MGVVSFVAGTAENRAVGTSLNVALPSGILDDDGVFAILFARSALTPPAGWTLVASQVCDGSAVTQTLYVYRKNTVVAADSGTAHLWSQSASSSMALTYFVARAADGAVVVASTLFNSGSNGSFGNAEAIDTGGTDRSTALFITAATTIVQVTGSVTPVPPPGCSIWTGTTISGYRLAAARATISSLGSIDGAWNITAADQANNGYVTLSMVLRDSVEDVVLFDNTAIDTAEDLSGSSYNVLALETVSIHPLFGILFQDEVTENFTIQPDSIAVIPAYVIEVLETVRAFGTPTETRRRTEAVTDGVITTEALRVAVGQIMREALRLLGDDIPSHRAQLQIADSLCVVDALASGRPVLLAEAVAMTAQIEVRQALLVMEALGIAEVLAPVARLGQQVAERVRLVDALSQFFGGSLVEALTITDSSARHYRAQAAATEALTLSEALTPQLVMSVRLADGVEFTETEIVNAIYRQDIAETIEIQIGYVAPNGSFTTWVMNTRSGSVTEYQNYEFNSFARVGNTHIGASSTGLYQLQGNDDDGDPIVAALEGAFMQFGATRMSRLKAAYLAVHGEDGDFVLRIETLDGDTYDYGVSTRHGRSTKVHMGKGQRTRYFAYSLTSTGQDFDIDTLEFVPLVVERRV
jgi:hypothetical protein